MVQQNKFLHTVCRSQWNQVLYISIKMHIKKFLCAHLVGCQGKAHLIGTDKL
jgi:hypothetical protein